MASQPDDTPIALSPATYARHESAVSIVEGWARNRPPRPGRDRFPGASSGAWAILRSGDTITAASGVTLGSGSADLCESDGTAFDPVETVTVKNAGAAVTASGDKIVRLAWMPDLASTGSGVWSLGCS
jgi:hypothetical protein